MALVLLMGLVACLVCESDRCAEDDDHDDCQCQCVCALAALPGMTDAGLAPYEAASSNIAVLPHSIQSIQPSSLFRPPRF